MRLFGWFRKEPIKHRKTIIVEPELRQIDVYTKEGVFSEKYEVTWRRGYWFENGFLYIRNIDDELVCYKHEEVLRYIVVKLKDAVTKNYKNESSSYN